MSAPRRTAYPRQGVSRRGVLTGAAAGGAAGTVPLAVIRADLAEATYRPKVRHDTHTTTPSARALRTATHFYFRDTPCSAVRRAQPGTGRMVSAATAQRIARKLAIRLVFDAPSQRLVDHLAEVFGSVGTDITATSRACAGTAGRAAS